MKYYMITKTDTTVKWKPKVFRNGFTFSQKYYITLYDYDMIRYVLITKMNKSLRGFINIYLMVNDDDEDNGTLESLIPKIETLRSIFIEKYALYLRETEIEAYLTKLDKLEEKIDSRLNRKSRRL